MSLKKMKSMLCTNILPLLKGSESKHADVSVGVGVCMHECDSELYPKAT